MAQNPPQDIPLTPIPIHIDPPGAEQRGKDAQVVSSEFLFSTSPVANRLAIT